MTSQRREDRHLDPKAAGSPVSLLPGLGMTAGDVTVIIGGTDANTRRGQLLTWATVNVLLRCYGILATVTVCCPDVPLSADLPHLANGPAPRTLHPALTDLAAAIADPQGTGPRLRLQPVRPPQASTPGTVTLVLGTEYSGALAEAARSGRCRATWLVTAGAWKLCLASPSALARHRAARLPRLDEEGPVSAAAWLAAALGCAEAFKSVGQLRAGSGRPINAFTANLWTLTGSDGFAALDTVDGPVRPPGLPPHYVVGAGAVGEAYLAVLATSDIAADLMLLDHDLLSDTNLNRHILAAWADLDEPKAALARDRLAGYPTRIAPVRARWQDYLATPPAERIGAPESLRTAESTGQFDLIISAVDRNDSRISIAAARPRTVLSGSTHGLSIEVGRYRADSAWQCLACASRPEPALTIEQAADQLKAMTPAQIAAIAKERDLDLAALTEYLRRPECGTLGEREMGRFAAFSRPDWSVSFVSVASGALLAARSLVNAQPGAEHSAAAQGDTLRLWLASAELARTAHQRNPHCPVCQPPLDSTKSAEQPGQQLRLAPFNAAED